MAPIPRSRAEIRLIRLLARCEEMASTNPPGDWKLERNVQELEERLRQVKMLSGPDEPNDDVLNEYTKKVEFLKSLLDTQKIPAIAKKSFANQLLVPAKTKTIPSNHDATTGKQIQMKAASHFRSEMRDELMATGKEGSESNVLFHRNVPNRSAADSEQILKSQQKMHEQIADEMIALTRNLKHNIKASNTVIKKDLAALSKANQQTDSNLGNLQNESSRLEGRLRKGANWWLWISLALVCAVFLFMIFFIRFFPKR